MLKEKYKNLLKNYLDNDNYFFYWKGRVALYALLKAMGVKKGDDIILPGFTCVVVPNAILYLGANPVYVDIELDSLNCSFNAIIHAITLKTKVIILQNTFGLSTDLHEIVKYASDHNIYTIEDCTHGFGGTYKGKSNGSYCDSSFFSTQWNKPFSTGIGGFAVINNKTVLEPLKNINKELLIPAFKDEISLKLLLISKKYFLRPATYWFLRKLYRFLSKNNLVIGSSSGGELTSVKMPDNYFKGISKTQISEGIKNIKFLDKLIALRKNNASIYTNFLNGNNKYYVKEELFENHSFLKYPVLVNDKKLFEARAVNTKVELGDWFVSPLHPITKNLSSWELNIKKVPNSVYISEHIMNLPTETTNVDRVLAFLKENIDLIK